MTWQHLDKQDTRQLKGLAILTIVLHNFLHWVRPRVAENEFVFHADSIRRYGRLLMDQPGEGVHLTLAFFGHYAVLVFMFLSAYGLMRRYGERTIDVGRFWAHRLLRIYSVFVLAVLMHAASMALSPREQLEWASLGSYALKLSGLSNVVPGRALSMVGPWWFFSFILQFYLVFPVLARLGRCRGPTTLLMLALAGLLARLTLNPLLMAYQVNLLHTVLGYLPELCAGILLARAGRFRVSWWMPLGLSTLVLLGSWYHSVWLLTPLCVTLLVALSAHRVAGGLRARPPLGRLAGYLGDRSLALFALHGFFRPPFVRWANTDPRWHSTLLIAAVYLASCLLAAHLVHGVATLLEQSGRRLLASRSEHSHQQ